MKAYYELQNSNGNLGGYVFEGDLVDPPIEAMKPDPKAFQKIPSGTVVIVSAVVCTECGHENEMKDMEFHPG